MSIEQFIENEVKSNDVVLFMRGTPQFPQCGFSGQVGQILDHIGVGYKGNCRGASGLRTARTRCRCQILAGAGSNIARTCNEGWVPATFDTAR